jgi:exonuclease V gamma subunit
VSLAEARQAISAWTEDRPSPLHFGTGDITLCTLVPMRSVPYKVVALLGMDEDRFPRTGAGSTATTSSPTTSWWATATPERWTASCCSTR